MKIYRENNLENFEAEKCCITVGTFDGVHLGHQMIIRHTIEKAKQTGVESALLTLWPHPRHVLTPHNAPLYLNELEEKIALLEKTGLDNFIIYPFTKQTSKLKYKDFVRDVLMKHFCATSIVVGFNNRIGNRGEGQSDRLTVEERELNLEVFKAASLEFEGDTVSSTRIRNLLHDGDVATANRLLTYNYTLKGKVVEGQKIGRTMGFNTANIAVYKHKLIPKQGVYAVKVHTPYGVYIGMLNIGFRPTIQSAKTNQTIEVHIFNFSKNIYGQTIELQLFDRIRDEIKFETIDDLVQQLVNDKHEVLQKMSGQL